MIKLGFTGDFCPWGRVEKACTEDTWQSLFADVLPFFEANHLNVIDLECPLTEVKSTISKTGPHLKAAPETAKLLKHLNCTLAATANNHFKDYGPEGMKATYRALEAHDIQWLGSGSNAEQAAKPVIKEFDGVKLALINAAENEWTTTRGSEAGCNPLDLVDLFHTIRKAKLEADQVIVIVHGGHEHYAYPSPRMKKWYRFLVDAGADAVVGHHTHVVSGYEVYKGAPIFYSLGNFCFDWEGLRDHPWNFGLLLRLKVEKNTPVAFEFEFIEQNNHRPGVFRVTDENRYALEQSLAEINRVILDDDQLQEQFQAFAKSQRKLIQTRLQPYRGRLLPRLHKRGWLPSLIDDKKRLLLTNLIRCEAHRDILLETIDPTKTE